MSRIRILYLALVLAIAAAAVVSSVYAGDPNHDPHGIIRALLPA